MPEICLLSSVGELAPTKHIIRGEHIMNIQKQIVRIVLVLCLVSLLALSAPQMVSAGTNGQQLKFYNFCYVQSVRIIGSNNNGDWIDKTFPADSSQCNTAELKGWWWKGTVYVTVFYPDNTYQRVITNVPQHQDTDWWGVTIPTKQAPVAPVAAGWCSCLVYFQRATGLPATGDPNAKAQNYAAWLRNKKDSKGNSMFNVTFLSTDNNSPSALNNSYLIWSASRIGNSDGHIAILENATYNTQTKKWTFTFHDANGYWSTNQTIRNYTDKSCNNVKQVKWVTSDLSGLTFFRVSKR